MQNKQIFFLFVCLLLVLQPVSALAADKPVSDCLDDREDCEEETDATNNPDTEDPDHLMEDQTMAPGSFALNIVKMIVALLLILALIYALLWFLKKRRAFEQVGALENIGGISVGQHKSVQIVRIGEKMYLLGVGENVELLKELTKEEADKVRADLEQTAPMPAASFLQHIFQNKKSKNKPTNYTEHDFTASFQKELNKLKENRHDLIHDYKKKDDEHG